MALGFPRFWNGLSLPIVKATRKKTEFPNFTVEMETGTGKTYVYLRTVYGLNRLYGFKKIRHRRA